jgi:hypothetical protein
MENQTDEVNVPEVAEPEISPAEIEVPAVSPARRKRSVWWLFLSLLLVFALGLSSGYFAWGRPLAYYEETAAKSEATPTAEHARAETMDMAAITQQVNPPEGYTLPVKLGDLGSRLVAAGAINYQKFAQIYAEAGQPLTDEQITVLTKDSRQPTVIKPDNAYFLLNFFWAVGLTNQNTILTKGAMMKGGKDQIGNFASTGGWTIGSRSPIDLYASTPLFVLSEEQQRRLEEVAHSVYRPCCNNPADFPDCNHGMAMLGLLELMAAQGVTADEMYKAAKYVNAFWYPQQSRELALAFKAAQGMDFATIDARELTSINLSSGTGFQGVHQWLADNGLLQQGQGSGNNCGV